MKTKTKVKREQRPKLKCPDCGRVASAEHFRENPEHGAAVRSVNAMFNSLQRTRFSGGPGRPKKNASSVPPAETQEKTA